MEILDGSQVRQLVDTEQVYAAFRDAQRDHRQRFGGSMAWKTIGGRKYLYRKVGEGWKSLGAESGDTEQIYARFHAGRAALKQRRAKLDAEIGRLAPINRAMRLGRVPWTSARVLRRLDREALLGQGLRVVGTHALFAYERMAGIHFGSAEVTTRDIDFLLDARSALKLLTSDLRETGLAGLLRAVDRSFVPTDQGSFRAVNDTGFMVDLITPLPRSASIAKSRRRIGNDPGDLEAVENASLAWLENSPAVEQMAIDEKGYPLTIVAPDPRAFAMHKLWLSGRDDRDRAKRHRDLAQAEAVTAMVIEYLPHLRFDDAVLNGIPASLRRESQALATRSSQSFRPGRDDETWSD